MGEGMQLTVEERKQVIEAFVKASKGKLVSLIDYFEKVLFVIVVLT